VLKLREKAQLSLETARQSGLIGSSLESKVIFSKGEAADRELLKSMAKEFPMILIASQAEVRDGEGTLEILVEKASGTKCARCWRYEASVQADGPQAGLCPRCVNALS
jgi:isoleucyl-tRNA synthetase